MTDSPERRFIDAMYEAALEYIDRGWPVFPVNIETKHPLIEWKSKQTETTDIEEVTDWFTNGVLTEDGDRIKLFNIGMATGALPGIVVVDCDNDGAIDFAKKNNLTSPVSVKTTRGVHYYWAHPGHGKQFRNKNGGQGKDWPNMKGLDFRGDGGYVILPPSMSFNADGSAKAVYQFDMQADFDDLPVWGGVPSHVEEFSDGSFSFSDIDFSGVHSGPPEPDIELQIRDQVALLGRSLVVGEGTDNWMIRLCGQLVRRGVLGEDLKAKVHSIYETYFSDNNTAQETARWLDVKMRSAMQMDRSNYPEDYDASGNRIIQQKAVASVDSAVSFFTYGTAPHFLSNIKLQKFYTDPLLPAGNIIQVLGYNGHGKSFFLNSLLTALTAGRAEFGPYAMSGAIPKVLYFDYDNPARTLLERVISQGRAYGDPGNNLKYWSSSVLSTARSQNMNLGTEEGARTLISLVEQEKPEIVIIDSLRNAFAGMDENSPQSWAKVNALSKYLRDTCNSTVCLVHHRNKPGADGLGREAGSTAQLTDLDTQIIITQLYEDKEVAKLKAGLHTGSITFQRIKIGSAGGYYEPTSVSDFMKAEKLAHDNATNRKSRIRMMTQVSFGKVRTETELHQPHYIGYCEYLDTQEPFLISSKSAKQAAIKLKSVGFNEAQISSDLMIPMSVVKEWVQ